MDGDSGGGSLTDRGLFQIGVPRAREGRCRSDHVGFRSPSREGIPMSNLPHPKSNQITASGRSLIFSFKFGMQGWILTHRFKVSPSASARSFKARALILKLTEEKNSTSQLNNKLRQELELRRRQTKIGGSGTPLLYVM